MSTPPIRLSPRYSAIQHNKKDYAVGLFWQVASGAGPRVRKEALAFAKKLSKSHNFFCIKSEGVHQYGVGADENKYRTRQISAAATVYRNLPAGKALLAAWKIDSKFWLCIIKGGAIYPSGDRLLANEEEAKKLFEQTLYSDDWDFIIAPAEWEIENAKQTDLATFFKRPGQVRLASISSGRQGNILIAAGLAGILVFGGGWYGYRQYLNNAEEEMRRLALSIQPVRKKPKVPKKTISWKYLPNNQAVHNRCVGGITTYWRSARAIPGWGISSVKCNVLEQKITAVWQRYGGNAERFQQFVAHLKLPYDIFEFGAGGQSAILVKSWTFPRKEIGESKPSLTREDAEVRLWTLQQRTGINLSVSRGAIEGRIVKPPAGQVAQKGQGIRYSIRTSISPEKVFNELYKIPGSVVYKIDYTPNQNSWAMEGFIHQKEKTQADDKKRSE